MSQPCLFATGFILFAVFAATMLNLAVFFRNLRKDRDADRADP